MMCIELTYFDTGIPGSPLPIMLYYNAYRTLVYRYAATQTDDPSGSETK